jgi:hypothetical protein
VKRALGAVFVLAVAGVATQAGTAARPEHLHTVPVSGFFWTPQDGLLGVGLCRSTFRCSSGAIERTTDGGKTYHVILRTPGSVVELHAIGRNGALALGERHVLYRTVDRGRHWTKGGHILAGASFATPRVGLGFRPVFAPNFAKIFRTRDAGSTWRRVRTPATCESERPLLDLVTPQLGWMVCRGAGGAGPFMSKAVFRTRDGGRSWKLLTSTRADGHAPRGGLSPSGLPAGISVTRNGFGVIWGNGVLAVTRDGGKDWHSAYGFALYNVDFPLGGAALGNGTAYVLFQHDVAPVFERLIATRDFGRSWRVVRRWRVR